MHIISRHLFAILAFCAMPAVAMASTVTVEAGAVQGATGSQVQVPIHLIGAQKLGAMQLELTYDPAILEAKDDSIEKGAFPQDITTGSHVITPGLLRIVMNTSAKESISGDGTLLSATFTVKGQGGQTCELRITSVRAWDNVEPKALPAEMLVTARHGRFTVGASMMKWLLIGGGVFLLLLLRIALRKKPQPSQSTPASPAPHPGKFCSHCGSPVATGSKFCNSCGKPI